jgi:hypothetical protein
MKASQTQKIVTKARLDFREAAERARDAGKSAQAAGATNRQAKLKFKQARKWARRAKKLAKEAKLKAAETQQALKKAAERLKKAEKKALKEMKKRGTKTKMARPAKVAKISIQHRRTRATKLRPSKKIVVHTKAALEAPKLASGILELPASNPVTPVIPPQPVG